MVVSVHIKLSVSSQCFFVTSIFLQGRSSLMDRVVSNTTVTSEMKRSLVDPSCDEGFGISIHQRNADRELLSTADVCNLENEDGEGNNGSGPIDNGSRIGPKKQKQWWRELLTALGLTVWVIAGAVFVAKVIGVPNLGVTNVAYNGWGRSEDDDNEPPLRYILHTLLLNLRVFIRWYSH